MATHELSNVHQAFIQKGEPLSCTVRLPSVSVRPCRRVTTVRSNGRAGGDAQHRLSGTTAVAITPAYIIFSEGGSSYFCHFPISSVSVLTVQALQGSHAAGSVFAALLAGQDGALHIAAWHSANATVPSGAGAAASSAFVVHASHCTPLPASPAASPDAPCHLRLAALPGQGQVAFAAATDGGALSAGVLPPPTAAGAPPGDVRSVSLLQGRQGCTALGLQAALTGTVLRLALLTDTGAHLVSLDLQTGAAQEDCGTLAWPEEAADVLGAGADLGSRCVAGVLDTPRGPELSLWKYAVSQDATGPAWACTTAVPLADLPAFTSSPEGLASGSLKSATPDTCATVLEVVFAGSPTEGDALVYAVLEGEDGALTLVGWAPDAGTGLQVRLGGDPVAASLQDDPATLVTLGHTAVTVAPMSHLPPWPRLQQPGGRASTEPSQASAGEGPLAAATAQSTTPAHPLLACLPDEVVARLATCAQCIGAALDGADAGGASGGVAASAPAAALPLTSAVDMVAATALTATSTTAVLRSALVKAVATAAPALRSAHLAQAQTQVLASILASKPTPRMLQEARSVGGVGSASWPVAAQLALTSKAVRVLLLLLMTAPAAGVSTAARHALGYLTAQWVLLRTVGKGEEGGSGARTRLLQCMHTAVMERPGMSETALQQAGVGTELVFFSESAQVRAVLDHALTGQDVPHPVLAQLHSLTAAAVSGATAPLSFLPSGSGSISSVRETLASLAGQWPVARLFTAAALGLLAPGPSQTHTPQLEGAAQSMCLASFLLTSLPQGAPTAQQLAQCASGALAAAVRTGAGAGVLERCRALTGPTGLTSATATSLSPAALTAHCVVGVSKVIGSVGALAAAAEVVLGAAEFDIAHNGLLAKPQLSRLLTTFLATAMAPAGEQASQVLGDTTRRLCRSVQEAGEAAGEHRAVAGHWLAHATLATGDEGEVLPLRVWEAGQVEGRTAGDLAASGGTVPSVTLSGNALVVFEELVALGDGSTEQDDVQPAAQPPHRHADDSLLLAMA